MWLNVISGLLKRNISFFLNTFVIVKEVTQLMTVRSDGSTCLLLTATAASILS